MLHNAKRGLSIVLAMLMCLSMLTAVVLPASAETAQATDAYAKITATADGDVYVPAENVYFVDPAFATAPDGVLEGDEYEYTYGGATWGNGKTYRLTWGTNTLATTEQLKETILEYNSLWSADPTGMSKELVIVFAPGSTGAAIKGLELLAADGAEDPTPAQLMDLYFLGPQAGKNPVSADKDTKANAKAIKNDRSVDTATEHAFIETIWLPAYSNCYLDGFAITNACRLYAGYNYANYYISNLYAQDLTQSAGHSIFAGGKDKQCTWTFEDCYFNLNGVMNRSDMVGKGESNDLGGNKIVFDGCVFAAGKLSESPGQYPQTHHIKFFPASASKVSTNFYGEALAAKPEMTVTNCVAVDWESSHLFRFPFDQAQYSGYNDNAVQVTVTGNRFYDVGTANATSDVLFFDKCSNTDQANSFTLNVKNNLFSFSDEVFAQDTTGKTNAINMRGSVKSAGTQNYKIFIKDNVFLYPNTVKNIMLTGGVDAMVPVDVSGNLFVDNQGNIQPATYDAGNPSHYDCHYAVQSDIYASADMNGGVKEVMTVDSVNGGTLLYSFIQMRRRGDKSAVTNFTGALTVLLKRGEEYDANTLFTFRDKDTKFLGIYEDAACTTKVEKISQDTVNGKYAKVEYKKGVTTLTVIFALNTPRNYKIVDPTGAYKTSGYTFNGMTYTDGVRATDGVYAQFVTNIDKVPSGSELSSAYAATKAPNSQDLVEKAGTTVTDLDDQVFPLNNGLNDLIVLVPGTHSFVDDAVHNFGRCTAIVGPQWGVSPYGDANKEGKLANGRSFDPTKEAVVTGSMTANLTNNMPDFVVDGVAFSNNTNYVFASTSHGNEMMGSITQNFAFTNCVFTGGGKDGIMIHVQNGATDNRVLNMVIRDCAYDGTDVTRAKANPMIQARANYFTLENFACINDTDKLSAGNRIAYVTTTDGTKLKFNAKRVFADVNNIITYNSSRDVFLYTLRDTTTVNANKTYYPNGMELNFTNTYTYGGVGYLWGVQAGKTTSVGLVKLNATNNYFYRPDYSGNTISHYHDSVMNNQGVYTDDSVCKDNIFISKDKFIGKAYGGALNIDDNFFGKVVDGEVVASYVSSYSSTGMDKNVKEYWLNPEKTVKNTDLGLVDNGYEAFELVRWSGVNEYNITKTNATVDMFKAAEGATIVGVYTDEACTTAATAFTHPQAVYVKVTKGKFTVVNAVTLTCSCDHEGDTPIEEITKEATCKEDGAKNIKCGWCQTIQEENVVIPKGKHTPAEEVTVVTPATCGADGVGKKVCTVCGEDAETGIVIPATGNHTASTEITVVTAATCGATGVGKKVCTVCGADAETGIVIPATGEHTPSTEITVVTAATCGADGVGKKVCTVCGADAQTGIVIPATGNHTPAEEVTTVTAPTCVAEGVGKKVCTVCGADAVTDIVIPATGEHTPSTEITVVTAATCGADGVGKKVCTVCGGDAETGIVIPATGNHAWDKGVVTKEPTSKDTGIKTYTCTVCSATKTQSLPTTGVDVLTVFKDIKKKDWFVKNGAIDFAYNNGLFAGTTKTTFGPNENMTRGMFVTVLGRLHGVSSKGATTQFTDVKKGDYFSGYVAWAAKNGIVTGTSATTFSPGANVTREQICAMMLRYCDFAKIKLAKVNAAITFTDAKSISSYARKAVAACQQGGVVGGEKTDGGYRFRPQGNASRAEVATIMMNFYKNYVAK